jgi:hypothetical protein
MTIGTEKSEASIVSRGVLLLSLFTGAGLFDRAFEERGFCVVSFGDLILSHDIRAKSAVGLRGHITGVFGGSPCQDFADCRRDPPTGNGVAMLKEFARVVNVRTHAPKNRVSGQRSFSRSPLKSAYTNPFLPKTSDIGVRVRTF